MLGSLHVSGTGACTFPPLDRVHDLAARESRLIHAVELLDEKILPLASPLFFGITEGWVLTFNR